MKHNAGSLFSQNLDKTASKDVAIPVHGSPLATVSQAEIDLFDKGSTSRVELSNHFFQDPKTGFVSYHLPVNAETINPSGPSEAAIMTSKSPSTSPTGSDSTVVPGDYSSSSASSSIASTNALELLLDRVKDNVTSGSSPKIESTLSPIDKEAFDAKYTMRDSDTVAETLGKGKEKVVNDFAETNSSTRTFKPENQHIHRHFRP